MSKIDKAIARLQSRPKDYEWREACTVLGGFGFEEIQGAGSRVKFKHPTYGYVIAIHKPHPRPTLKSYQIDEIIEKLTEWDML